MEEGFLLESKGCLFYLYLVNGHDTINMADYLGNEWTIL